MDEPSIELEFERAYDREELAAVFREFAAALADDRPLRIDDGDRTAAVSVPPRVVAAFEAERDADDEPPVAELEVELEWDDPEGSTIRLGESDGETGAVVGADVEGDGQSQTDAATATMPPEAVTGGSETDDSSTESAESESVASDPAASDSATSEADSSAERSDAEGRTSRFEVYEDRGGQWRWRLVHWNGNIVADSGEGYASRSNARRAARSVMRSAPTARLVDRDE